MAISTGQMTIGQTAQQIDGTSNQPYRLHLNNNSNTLALYIGGSDSVTTSNGLRLSANDSMDMILNPYETLWVISSSNNHDISWLKQVY
jgi:hypothetical protein